MLSLSRKVGDSIIINDNIEIQVLEIKGESVRLGIVAPRSIPVYRKEIYLQIEESNKQAASDETFEFLKKL
ncbi:MAG: global regulator family protein [Clostridiales bacterium]|jgi:carbon storage regulator|nr:global regulator family protein [Clostridiales bacterium]